MSISLPASAGRASIDPSAIQNSGRRLRRLPRIIRQRYEKRLSESFKLALEASRLSRAGAISGIYLAINFTIKRR